MTGFSWHSFAPSLSLSLRETKLAFQILALHLEHPKSGMIQSKVSKCKLKYSYCL